MIGFFGGTFDPVHCGHLHAARQVRDALQLDVLNLVLSARPPLRNAPECSVEDRLAMLRLAVAEEAGLAVDDREVRRLPEVSYSVQTLADIRAEVGGEESVCWLIGLDQLNRLDRWHKWQHLTDYAHLVVLQRPGVVSQPSPRVRGFLKTHQTEQIEELRTTPGGRLYRLQVDMLDISASEIRCKLAHGMAVDDLLPHQVNAYIKQHKLYRKIQPGNTAC